MIYNVINVSNMSAMFGQLEAALHSPSQSRLLGFCTASTSLPQGYLWVSSSFHCSENIFLFSIHLLLCGSVCLNALFSAVSVLCLYNHHSVSSAAGLSLSPCCKNLCIKPWLFKSVLLRHTVIGTLRIHGIIALTVVVVVGFFCDKQSYFSPVMVFRLLVEVATPTMGK